MRLRRIYDSFLVAIVFVMALSFSGGSVAWGSEAAEGSGSYIVYASAVVYSTNGGLGEGYVGRPHKKRPPRNIEPLDESFLNEGYSAEDSGAAAAKETFSTNGGLSEGYVGRPHKKRAPRTIAFPEEKAKPIKSTVIYTTVDGNGKASSAGSLAPGWQPSTQDHSLDSFKAFIHRIFPGGDKTKKTAVTSDDQVLGCDRAPLRHGSDKALSKRRAERTSLSSATEVSTVTEDSQASQVDIVALGDEGDLAFDDEFDNVSDEEGQIVADPLEGFNRAMFVVNDRLYFWFFRPVARGYSKVVPEPGRVAVRRFFANVFMPIRFANNVFQLKFKYAGIELERFVINSTIGVAGFMDPAKEHWNLVMHDEDFGQTLGFYGFGPGVYINLPIFGPSNIRDTVGRVADIFLSPTAYILPNDREIVVGINAFEKLNEVSLDIGLYEDIKRDALDPYIFIRNAYQQHRESLIKK